jgi:hypothetical protein
MLALLVLAASILLFSATSSVIGFAKNSYMNPAGPATANLSNPGPHGFSEILYVEGMKDYLKIHTRDQVIVTHQTMSEMENILPSGQFIRIHKSYIIATARIKAVFGNSVDMEKTLLPIGLNYKERIMSFIAGKPSGI